MENRKKLYLIILMIFLIVFGICVSVYIARHENKKASRPTINNNIEENEVINNRERVDETVDNDQEILTYFENEITNDNNILNEENNTDNEKRLKDSFVKLTDFIFYEGKINNITFNELKDDTKVAIISDWEILDEKIETKYPNYKDRIESVENKTYNNLKAKKDFLINKLKEAYINKYGEDKYNELMNKKEELKEKVSDLKNKATEEMDKKKETISSWYKEWKESE